MGLTLPTSPTALTSSAGLLSSDGGGTSSRPRLLVPAGPSAARASSTRPASTRGRTWPRGRVAQSTESVGGPTPVPRTGPRRGERPRSPARGERSGDPVPEPRARAGLAPPVETATVTGPRAGRRGAGRSRDSPSALVTGTPAARASATTECPRPGRRWPSPPGEPAASPGGRARSTSTGRPAPLGDPEAISRWRHHLGATTVTTAPASSRPGPGGPPPARPRPPGSAPDHVQHHRESGVPARGPGRVVPPGPTGSPRSVHDGPGGGGSRCRSPDPISYRIDLDSRKT